MSALALLLTLALAPPAPPTLPDAQLLNGVAASAAGKDARIDVLTNDDLRTAVDVEATRQAAGCATNSCALEIANALDARFIITGTLGTLGDNLVLQLTVLDVKSARSVGRASLRGSNTGALADQTETLVTTSLATALGSETAHVRVVVLDFSLAGAASPEPSSPPSSSPLLAIVGGVGAGLGVAVVLTGVYFDSESARQFATAQEKSTPAKEAAAAATASDDAANIAFGAYVVGILVVGGAAALVVGLVE